MALGANDRSNVDSCHVPCLGNTIRCYNQFICHCGLWLALVIYQKLLRIDKAKSKAKYRVPNCQHLQSCTICCMCTKLLGYKNSAKHIILFTTRTEGQIFFFVLLLFKTTAGLAPTQKQLWGLYNMKEVLVVSQQPCRYVTFLQFFFDRGEPCFYKANKYPIHSGWGYQLTTKAQKPESAVHNTSQNREKTRTP